MMWEPRGKDTQGRETWVGVTMGRTWLVTRDMDGVKLWRIDGTDRLLEGVGFTSINAAKEYADRVTA